ncbi:alpha/beta hydrolase [Prauserella halophila]|uniref:Alpha/beta hydrolase n=1 Tax=Prauserella halophila TaxID=185641 RepID=A0ABN1W432_9PSEU|nr:alpha/beta hydrolase [Prauserella halophila]MCP2235997.1 Lysophospholipase, alpha-beta hydrolase superfamily [Prauserella halophila]
MSLREITFPSSNNRDEIQAWLHTPLGSPCGIVQIVHGFGEHSRRYWHLTGALLDAGYVVAHDDHVGHGRTALQNATWGDPGDSGYETTILDERRLHDAVIAEMADAGYDQLPFAMFGHSWGSMIAREYAARYDSDLSALVLCGVAYGVKGMDTMARMTGEALAAGRAKDDAVDVANAVFGPMTERYSDVRTPNDWIAYDPDVVADHATDPLNLMTVGMPNYQFFADFSNLMTAITGPEWAARMPVDLPVYLIAGDQDPVANYGEGVYAVANLLAEAGNRSVSATVYPGWRHEIHNERTIRDEVEAGVVEFLDNHLP